MQNRAFIKVSPAKNIRFFFRKNGDEGYLSSYKRVMSDLDD